LEDEEKMNLKISRLLKSRMTSHTQTSKILPALCFFLFGYQGLAAEAGPLVPLQSFNVQIVQDLRYATDNNFTHQVVYDFNACYVLPEVAKALSRVQQALEKQQKGLKVWDCFRPMSAQQKFWELVPDPRYVSPPAKGGLHTRGTAVDLTLVDAKGHELKMPTLFDDFTPAAARNAPGTNAEALKNSRLLETVMKGQGFVGLDSEWWHYDFATWRQHPPLITEDFTLGVKEGR
jgi:zinc D-Ala-D-Ala dipeptidase